MEANDGPGCGQAAHRTDCLCDVIVAEPVEIKFSPTDTPEGVLLAEALGLSAPYGANDILRLLSSWATVHDATASGTVKKTIVKDGVLVLANPFRAPRPNRTRASSERKAAVRAFVLAHPTLPAFDLDRAWRREVESDSPGIKVLSRVRARLVVEGLLESEKFSTVGHCENGHPKDGNTRQSDGRCIPCHTAAVARSKRKKEMSDAS